MKYSSLQHQQHFHLSDYLFHASANSDVVHANDNNVNFGKDLSTKDSLTKTEEEDILLYPLVGFTISSKCGSVVLLNKTLSASCRLRTKKERQEPLYGWYFKK